MLNLSFLKDSKFNRLGNVDTLKVLSAHIKNKRVNPFVGAGMSIEIYGSWGSALERIKEGHLSVQEDKGVQKLIDGFYYEDAAEMISDKLGVTSYRDQLVAAFGTSLITDESLRRMTVKHLPRIFRESLVVTTNFDKVLERTFQKENYTFEEKVVLQHLTEWQAVHARRGSEHYLIKIHGCVSAPDEVVMTKTSYDELYDKDSKHMVRLRSILGGNMLLFLGCSLKEDRTVNLLREVGLGDHYAILEMNGEVEESAFQQRRRLMSDDLKMHCIWYPKGKHHYVADILKYIDAYVADKLPEENK